MKRSIFKNAPLDKCEMVKSEDGTELKDTCNKIVDSKYNHLIPQFGKEKDIEKWLQERKSKHPSRSLPVIHPPIIETTTLESKEISKDKLDEADKLKEEKEEGAISESDNEIHLSIPMATMNKTIKSNDINSCQHFIRENCHLNKFHHASNVKINEIKKEINCNHEKKKNPSFPSKQTSRQRKRQKKKENNRELKRPKRRPLLEILGQDELIE